MHVFVRMCANPKANDIKHSAKSSKNNNSNNNVTNNNRHIKSANVYSENKCLYSFIHTYMYTKFFGWRNLNGCQMIDVEKWSADCRVFR